MVRSSPARLVAEARQRLGAGQPGDPPGELIVGAVDERSGGVERLAGGGLVAHLGQREHPGRTRGVVVEVAGAD